MALAKKLLHTRYRVNDLEQTVEFYKNVLGLEEVRRHKSPRGSELAFFKAPESEETVEICHFPNSGPVVVQVLEGEDAVKRNRDVMGATNPADADEGTIRKAFAESIEANSVHGSDSDENAKIEIEFFFNEDELVG